MDKRTKRVLEQMSKVKEIERIYQKSKKNLRISFFCLIMQERQTDKNKFID